MKLKQRNVEQEISLSSIKHTIKEIVKLGPNMTAIVEITKKLTYYDFTTIGTSLNALSVTSGKSIQYTKVFPTKLKQTDPFLISCSLLV
jgi:hypothetical protein